MSSRSSWGTNGWTLGRAIIEENSRHYNSLVCPLAALSSCFISTNFLLLLHDDDGPWAKQVSSTEFWAFPGLSSFCFFLSYNPSRAFVLSWDELDKRPPAKVKVCHVVTEQNHIWKNPLKQNPIIHQQSFNNSLQSRYLLRQHLNISWGESTTYSTIFWKLYRSEVSWKNCLRFFISCM